MPHKTNEEYIEAIKTSTSFAKALDKLGLGLYGNNYITLHNKIKELNIDITHMTGQGWKKGNCIPVVAAKPLEELLVENCKTKNNKLKERLIKAGMKEHKCEQCKRDTWQGVQIPIELHHLNGNNCDNRIENLQILCPNCHALTDNYRGKNIRSNYKKLSDDELIKFVVSSYSIRSALLKAGLNGAGGNYVRIRRIIESNHLSLLEKPIIEKIEKDIKNKTISVPRNYCYKINWPDKDSLKKMIQEKSLLQLSRELGVSDNAIRSAARRYGLNIRELSPWSQKHYKEIGAEGQIRTDNVYHEGMAS